MYMKLGEAQSMYRQQRQALIDQRRSLINQRDELKKKMITESDKELYSEEAATLELSIKDVSKKFDENQEVLDNLIEQEAAIWNAEVARQQGDVMQKAAVDLAKIMEVARRIAKGARVPAKDEQKVMDYSMELYLASKNMAMMNTHNKKEKYDSLWDDEDEPEEEYDPQGKAENTTVNIDIPELFAPAAPETSGE
ncbi:MAG: hypothetical protein NC307_05895 [Roseburia sp.]|nr:hypothetical protein [Roseburia sp.]